MNRRRLLSLIGGITASGVCSNPSASAQCPANDEHIAWVVHVLEQMGQVKPGMTRADLLRIFTTEGGISTGLQRTYVSQGCPYFKIDVAFRAVGRSGRDREGRVTPIENPQDEILSMSRPYLAFSVMD